MIKFFYLRLFWVTQGSLFWIPPKSQFDFFDFFLDFFDFFLDFFDFFLDLFYFIWTFFDFFDFFWLFFEKSSLFIGYLVFLTFFDFCDYSIFEFHFFFDLFVNSKERPLFQSIKFSCLRSSDQTIFIVTWRVSTQKWIIQGLNPPEADVRNLVCL